VRACAGACVPQHQPPPTCSRSSSASGCPWGVGRTESSSTDSMHTRLSRGRSLRTLHTGSRGHGWLWQQAGRSACGGREGKQRLSRACPCAPCTQEVRAGDFWLQVERLRGREKEKLSRARPSRAPHTGERTHGGLWQQVRRGAQSREGGETKPNPRPPHSNPCPALTCTTVWARPACAARARPPPSDPPAPPPPARP